MSVSSTSSQCPSPLFVAQLESSTLPPPSSFTRPRPSNFRRMDARSRRTRPPASSENIVVVSTAAHADPSVDPPTASTSSAAAAVLRSPPTVRPSFALLSPVGTHRASLAEDEIRWGLLRSTLTPAPPPSLLTEPPDKSESSSQVWVLPEYIPPTCVIVRPAQCSALTLSSPNTVTVEVTVSEPDGTRRSRLRSAASIPTLRNLVGDPLPGCTSSFFLSLSLADIRNLTSSVQNS